MRQNQLYILQLNVIPRFIHTNRKKCSSLIIEQNNSFYAKKISVTLTDVLLKLHLTNKIYNYTAIHYKHYTLHIIHELHNRVIKCKQHLQLVYPIIELCKM